jgi:hypothetical protein
MGLKPWQRVACGLLLAVGIGAIVWRLAPDGQRAIPVLTGVLVGVTAWYADRTNEMVREMRAARAAQIRPKLVPTVHRMAANAFTPKVLSAGPGSAFDVRVTLTLEPDGPSADFVAGVLSPGRGQALLFRERAAGEVMVKVDELSRFGQLRLTGSCRDGLGEQLAVDETMDLSAYIAAWKAGLWKLPDSTKREGKSPLEAIEEILDLIEHHVREMVQPD